MLHAAATLSSHTPKHRCETTKARPLSFGAGGNEGDKSKENKRGKNEENVKIEEKRERYWSRTEKSRNLLKLFCPLSSLESSFVAEFNTKEPKIEIKKENKENIYRKNE